MSSMNEWIVREYFETLGFAVRQPRKHQLAALSKQPLKEEIDLFVMNPKARETAAPEPVLWGREELAGIARAVVGVRGWHTERFTPGVLRKAPEVFRFASREVAASLKREFGPEPFARILCLSSLPATRPLRDETLALCRENGIDGVLVFPDMLAELIREIDVKKNYEKSDLLQLLRILKTHDLLKDPQLELFRKKRTRGAR